MTDNTPTPIILPDGHILTTRGEVRRIGHGQWIYANDSIVGGAWKPAACRDALERDQ